MNAETEKINSFEMAKKQVDIAARYLDLDPGSVEKLKNTKFLESEELLRPRDLGDSIHNLTDQLFNVQWAMVNHQ